MTASTSTVVDSILAFLNEIHPRRIGAITETKRPYFTLTNKLSTKANLSVAIQITSQHTHHKSLSGVAERVFASNAHVFLLSAGPSIAVSVLCEAYKRGLVWPKYAWILHSYRLDDLLRHSKPIEGCSVQKILEGIFIFQLTKERSKFNAETAHHKINNGGFNPYAELLYDSVQTLISSANNTFEVPHFISNNSKVYVYHSRNGTANFIGTYDGIERTSTSMDESTFSDYDIPVVHTEALVFRYLLPLPILCFLFNTILLILYIYFRNEPDIKSTSVTVTMLLFAGCYFFIIFAFVYVLFIVYRVDFCLLLTWMSAEGLSMPLILATILVKMLRVYHIFTAFKALKHSAKCQDYTLVIYITLILSPIILLQTLWTLTDPNHLIFNFIEHPGFIETDIRCYSRYRHIRIALGLAYNFLLSFAVVVVAVKSRKIRRTQFKDTKKVNVLIFLLIVQCLCCYPHFIILDLVGYHFDFLHFFYPATFITAALLCQFILFVPKIWPSVQNKIFNALISSRS